MSGAYETLRLSGGLSVRERDTLLLRLDDLLKFLGAPGDWGYNTKLGVMTIRLTELRKEIAQAPTRSDA